MLLTSREKRFILFSGLLFIILLILCYLILILWQEVNRKNNREYFLSTLIPLNVAQDLCSRHLVPSNISTCTDPINIERRDLLKIIQSQVSSQNTYEEVNVLFGGYEEFCSERNAEIYRCYYTFGTAPSIVIEYYKESNKVSSIRSELVQ